MSNYADIIEEPTNNDGDLFRATEKAIRAKLKEEVNKFNKKKEWKPKWQLDLENNQNEINGNKETFFNWTDIIDLHNNDHVQKCAVKVNSFPKCFSSHNHTCPINHETYIYKLIPIHKPSIPLEEQSEDYVDRSLFIPDGFYFIKSALCIESQLYWAKISLENFSEASHNNLTNLAEQDYAPSLDSIPSNIGLWKNSKEEKNNFKNFHKLRWCGLGYYYDWTFRSYQKKVKTPLTPQFIKLCQSIAMSLSGFHPSIYFYPQTSCSIDLGLEDVEESNDKESLLDPRDYEHFFEPEAAIINYYPSSTSMSCHIDDAEHNLLKPIVSISLGSSAIYAIGDKEKTIKPGLIKLSSGDSIIMTGYSRYCYHGIPIILPYNIEKKIFFKDERNIDKKSQLLSYLYKDLTEEKSLIEIKSMISETDEHIKEYLMSNRINMNVRQVRINCEEGSWLEKKGTGFVKVPKK